MRIRGLLILMAILIGLAAFVYFYEIEGGKKRSEQEKAQKKLFEVEEPKIQEITLVSAEQRVVGRRDGTQWRIVQPLETEADQYEWNTISRSLQDLSMDKDLDVTTEELKGFGLEKPRLQVTVKTGDGKEQQVLFGDDNPTQSFVYAKKPQGPKVYLVASYSYRALDKKLFDLREKSAIKVETAEVQEISLKNPQGNIQLVKIGDNWEMKAPLQAKADKSDVESFIASVSGNNVKELIDQPEAAKDSGLDQPTYELKFVTGKDRAIKRLIVGSLKSPGTPPAATDTGGEQGKEKSAEKAKEIPSDATFFARDDSRKPLLAVDKAFVDKLDKKPFDFRDKSIVKIDRAKLKQMQIFFDSEKIELVKEGEDWLTPDKKKKAKSETITPLLSAVEYGKAKNLIDPPYDAAKLGLDNPEVKLILEQEGQPKIELWVGKEGDGGTYSRLSSESTVKVLEADVKGKIKVKAADLLVDVAPPPAEKK